MADGAVSIRRATADDAGVLRALTRAAYAKWVPLIGREPRPMAADYEAAVQVHRFDVLEANGEVVALIETVDEGDQLLIENVAVDPNHQGLGYGRRLLALAEDIARGLGRRKVRLYTNARFEVNIELYKRLGYVIDGEERVGPDTVAVHMSKALDA